MTTAVTDHDITASVFANILRVIEEATHEEDGSLSEEAQEEIDDYLELLGANGMPEIRHLVSSEERLSLEALAQESDWHIYQGPHGGKGWKNNRSGEIVYGGERPGTKSVAEKVGHAAGKKTRALTLAVLHEMKPSSILERIKQAAHAVRHPIETIKKVKEKAVEKYQWLEQRYGRPAAIAIAGAYAGYYVALSLNPIATMAYVPSPTAVLLGSAEALRFAGSKVGDVVNPPVAMLSLEDDQSHLLLEAKAFIKELAEEAGEDVPEVDEDTLEQVIDALLHHGGDESEQLAQGDDNPEWTAYQGTHGGRGWKNVRTGEVLYQEEKPGTRGDGKQDDATPKNPAQPQEGQQGQEQQDPAKEAQRQQAKADYKQNGVRAKSFKSWFGDWEKDPKNASKVVDPKTGEPLGTHPLPEHTSKVSDETGRPIAVFHGTPGGKFSEFRKDKLRDPEALNYGPGFYFTDKKEVAEGYAKGERGDAQGEVMTVFLNIRKPFKVGANKKYTQEEADAILGNKPGFFGKIGRKISGPQTYTGDKLYYELTKKHGGRTQANAHLQKLGYDGVHDDALNGKQGVNCWIAFEGNQIKAADNEGTFDANDNKIHMAMPEEEPTEGTIDDKETLQKAIADGWKPVWSDEDEAWLIGDDGPDLGDEEHLAEGVAESVWTSFTSKNGNQGWLNSVTKERRYQDKKPDDKDTGHYEELQKQRSKRAEDRLNAEPEADVSEFTQRRLSDFFGEGFRHEDLPKLIGALPGSKIYAFGGVNHRNEPYISMRVDGPRYLNCSRSIAMQSDGSLVCRNEMFFLKKKYRGGGAGLSQFSGQVRELAKAGVDRIETCAGKGGGMNGYYTWPRLGYDAKLDGDFKRLLPSRAKRMLLKNGLDEESATVAAEDMSKAESVLDLMETPEGRALWKQHGYMGSMTFDLSPGSRSLKTLNAYLEGKGLPPIEAAEQPDKAEQKVKRKQKVEERKKNEKEAEEIHEWATRTLNHEVDGWAQRRGMDSNEARAAIYRTMGSEFTSRIPGDPGSRERAEWARRYKAAIQDAVYKVLRVYIGPQPKESFDEAYMAMPPVIIDDALRERVRKLARKKYPGT